MVVGGRKMQGSTFGNNKMVPHANETKMSGAKGGYEKSMAEEAVGGEVGDKEGVMWGEGGALEMLSWGRPEIPSRGTVAPSSAV